MEQTRQDHPSSHIGLHLVYLQLQPGLLNLMVKGHTLRISIKVNIKVHLVDMGHLREVMGLQIRVMVLLTLPSNLRVILQIQIMVHLSQQLQATILPLLTQEVDTHHLLFNNHMHHLQAALLLLALHIQCVLLLNQGTLATLHTHLHSQDLTTLMLE